MSGSVEELDRFRRQWQAEVAAGQVAEKQKVPSSQAQTEPLESITAPEHEDFGGDHVEHSDKLSTSIITQHTTEQMEPVHVLTAVNIYEQAVERERQGALSDALMLYRQAFKKDSNVDEAWKVAQQTYPEQGSHRQGHSLEEQDYARFVQTAHDYEPNNLDHAIPSEIQDMISMMSSLRIPIEIEEGSSHQGIALLPDEILYTILHHVILSTPRTFTALTLTCQRFMLILRDDRIWRDLCFKTYAQQAYKHDGIKLSADSAEMHYAHMLEQECRSRYHDHWQTMFIEKPRIRFDGIYIATCHYTRPGVREESLVWTSPFYLVTYFRFLRFYNDGKCLSLLTTTEPKDIVHDIHRNARIKGLYTGSWSITNEGQVSIEVKGPANYLFFMELFVKSSSRGKQNKLAWSSFYGVHPHSAEITHFNLKNDKSYYYSRVKSYSSKRR